MYSFIVCVHVSACVVLTSKMISLHSTNLKPGAKDILYSK